MPAQDLRRVAPPPRSPEAPPAGILDPDRCRELLGADCSLSPDEIRCLLERLSVLAAALVEVYGRALSEGATWNNASRCWDRPN
jgi:hypothetical protein